MAKVRTAAHLQAAMDAEVGWRVIEIGLLKSAIINASQPRQDTLIRAAVPMIYAHWEGCIKKLATFYGLYISSRGLLYRDIKPCFLGIEALGMVSALSDIKKMISTASNLTAQILEIENRPASIDLWPRLKDIGNLTHALFQEIVEFLHLETSKYSTKKVFIDEVLVGGRNKIAHGERFLIDHQTIGEMMTETIGIIQLFKSDIESNVTNGQFLR